MGYQTLLEVDTEEELFRRPFTEQELIHLPRLVPESSRFSCCKGRYTNDVRGVGEEGHVLQGS